MTNFFSLFVWDLFNMQDLTCSPFKQNHIITAALTIEWFNRNPSKWKITQDDIVHRAPIQKCWKSP